MTHLPCFLPDSFLSLQACPTLEVRSLNTRAWTPFESLFFLCLGLPFDSDVSVLL